MDVPEVNQAKDATIDVLNKYKLDDIDISFFHERRRRQW